VAANKFTNLLGGCGASFNRCANAADVSLDDGRDEGATDVAL